MNTIFNIGDVIDTYGEITDIKNKSVYFGTKRYLISSLTKKITDKNLKIYSKFSPICNIDWTSESAVDNYYEKFKFWNEECRNGDVGKYQIFEVKNNKIFHKNEYYLPFYSYYRKEDKKYLKDGYIFGYCFKMNNYYYTLKDFNKRNLDTVNVFCINKLIDKSIIDKYEIKENNKKLLDNLSYLKSLDYNRLTSYDLNLLRNNFIKLFDNSIFPYKSRHEKPVTMNLTDFCGKQIISVYHRNRTGTMKIDNSYHGSMPFSEDYGAILIVEPNFTNICYAYTQAYVGERFNVRLLDQISDDIVDKWDKAIEENVGLRFS